MFLLQLVPEPLHLRCKSWTVRLGSDLSDSTIGQNRRYRSSWSLQRMETSTGHQLRLRKCSIRWRYIQVSMFSLG